MKTLADGTQVSSRSYYYLLDWNEIDNWNFMATNFGKEKLRELDIEEYKKLWIHAVNVEYKDLTSWLPIV